MQRQQLSAVAVPHPCSLPPPRSWTPPQHTANHNTFLSLSWIKKNVSADCADRITSTPLSRRLYYTNILDDYTRRLHYYNYTIRLHYTTILIIRIIRIIYEIAAQLDQGERLGRVRRRHPHPVRRLGQRGERAGPLEAGASPFTYPHIRAHTCTPNVHTNHHTYAPLGGSAITANGPDFPGSCYTYSHLLAHPTHSRAHILSHLHTRRWLGHRGRRAGPLQAASVASYSPPPHLPFTPSPLSPFRTLSTHAHPPLLTARHRQFPRWRRVASSPSPTPFTTRPHPPPYLPPFSISPIFNFTLSPTSTVSSSAARRSSPSSRPSLPPSPPPRRHERVRPTEPHRSRGCEQG